MAVVGFNFLQESYTQLHDHRTVTFKLAEEEYGLEIIKVQEIIGLMPITKVPRVPEYMRGVINLRGRIIPTIDLRSKFQLPKGEMPLGVAEGYVRMIGMRLRNMA